MDLLRVCMFANAFGTVLEVNRMSAQDRLARKKYMGVCRCTSAAMARTMSRFPATVVPYIPRKSRKRLRCCSGRSERPQRRNSKPAVSFSLAMSQRSEKMSLRDPR